MHRLGMILLFLPFFLRGQSLLQERINAFVTDPDVYEAKTSLCVVDLATGQYLAGYNSQQKLVPASTLKILTTATALQCYGPHFTFASKLEHQGEIMQGVLLGNLVFRSDGDPGFLSDKWSHIRGYRSQEIENNLLQALKKSGIRSIKGDLVVDASHFDQQVIPHGWAHEDIGNYYAAGVWGVSFRDNQYELLFERQNQEGEEMSIAKHPAEVPYLSLVSEVYSGAPNSGDQTYIYTLPYQDKAIVRGTLPMGQGKFGIKGAIPNVPLSLGHWLQMLLNQAGIVLEGEIKVEYKVSNPGEVLWQYTSPPLLEYLHIINKDSHNLYAEALRKKLEKDKGSHYHAVLRAHWAPKGIDLDGAFVLDGSGLHGRNQLSAYQLAWVTRNAVMDPLSGPTFLSTLPLGGREGTVKNLFKQSPAFGKIRLKSGSMDRVRSYAGVIEKEGRQVAFALIINDYTCDPMLIRHKLANLMQELYLFL
jgi:serine-type D-Ala-D-Ala carboxypeptidase/endopeptidase (penicillin-binding protein 4)